MRYKFLLDFNIIYDAVWGVDQHDNPDTTAAELLFLMARICHSITIHSSLYGEYLSRLNRLKVVRPTHFEPIHFIKMFITNSSKRNLEYGDLPKLPPNVKVPREDELLVRAALISHPIIVTEDAELHSAINNQSSLSLRAFTVREALDFVNHERKPEE